MIERNRLYLFKDLGYFFRMNKKMGWLSVALGMGLSACGVMDKEPDAGPRGRFGQEMCMLQGRTVAVLIFDAKAYGTDELRIYNNGALVIDTCGQAPVSANPEYFMFPIPETTNRAISVFYPDKVIPTTGKFDLMKAPNCASPFVAAGTARFTLNPKRFNEGSTIPDCEVLDEYWAREIIQFQ